MAGSVRRVRDDVWELRVYVGRDANGRIRHRHRTFRGTKRAAERELARFVAEVDALPAPSPKGSTRWDRSTTIDDAIEGWSHNGWEDLSPTTVRHYRELWERYISPDLGSSKIVDLSPYDVEQYFRSLKRRGVGATTIRHIRAMLMRACRLTRKWSGHTVPNPVLDTELPGRGSAEAREPVRAPDVTEVHQLLRAAASFDESFGVFVCLVAATGLRRGEACAVRWSDLDATNATLTVDESVVAAQGSAIVKAPKTRRSRRTMTLDRETITALEHLHAHHVQLTADCGLRLAPDAFVFAVEPPYDEPPHPDTMSHRFAKVRKAAGVATDVHLHSLRHFHATVLDPVISEAQKQARLGWSTVQMARHYTDSVPEEDRRAAEHVGRLLRRDETDDLGSAS
jgi:integrase